MTGAEVVDLIATYGLVGLAPLAIIEGPVVTMIAGWLASVGMLNLYGAFGVVVLVNLIGDVTSYLIGRHPLGAIPAVWRGWLGLTRPRLIRLMRRFRKDGARVLVVGKLTHAAGFAILLSAGAARMPFGVFVLANLLATIPKSMAFLALGWAVGSACQRWASGVFWVSLGLVALTVAVWLVLRRPRRAAA